jgi:hypothetical protein
MPSRITVLGRTLLPYKYLILLFFIGLLIDSKMRRGDFFYVIFLTIATLK